MIISILTTIFTQDPNRPSVITTARRDREQEDKENKGHKREMTIVEGEMMMMVKVGRQRIEKKLAKNGERNSRVDLTTPFYRDRSL